MIVLWIPTFDIFLENNHLKNRCACLNISSVEILPENGRNLSFLVPRAFHTGTFLFGTKFAWSLLLSTYNALIRTLLDQNGYNFLSVYQRQEMMDQAEPLQMDTETLDEDFFQLEFLWIQSFFAEKKEYQTCFPVLCTCTCIRSYSGRFSR